MATNNPFFQTANYTPTRIPQYAGNPLIEALPPFGSEEDVFRKFINLPHFNPEQREWSAHERFAMITQLANFMVPMERHVQLAYSIDSIMRQGYINRIPHSIQSQETFKKLHGNQLLTKAGDIVPQISTSLVGLSGMGKTTSLKRYLSHIPQVIHHQDYGLYQVPYLHIEAPYDGSSVTGLTTSIFRKLDMLLPGAEYTEEYTSRRASVDTMLKYASHVLLMHCVGLLVVDEIQNLLHAPKNRQELMTLLVSASNDLGVPVLFVGTSKARKLMTQNFRQGRRSVGFGVPLWERIEKNHPNTTEVTAGPSDWDVFVQTLMNYQWVRNPIEATAKPHIANLLYELSQGIIDIAIKLFSAAQARAIMDGSEAITAPLLVDVSKRELGMVAPMVDALRRNDIQALEELDDIKPLSLSEIIDTMKISYSGRQVAGATVAPATPAYNQIVNSALQAAGFDHEQAEQLTVRSAELGATNAIDGIKMALTQSTSGPKAKRIAKSKVSAPISYEPGDYRNVLLANNVSDVEMFESLSMLPDLEELFVA